MSRRRADPAVPGAGPRPGLTRNVAGSSSAEWFVVITIATILVTRAWLALTGYPQIGGGNLHIAHALWGGAAMMLALLTGWAFIGFGARLVTVVLGGVGFGLFLDEVGKFVTRDNDYFYGPSAEIMFVLVVLIIVGLRAVRDVRPLSPIELVTSASMIATEGLARGLAPYRRELATEMLNEAGRRGIDAASIAAVRTLLDAAPTASERLHQAQRRVRAVAARLFGSPTWVPVLGWMLVVTAVLGVAAGSLQAIFGERYYDDTGTERIAGVSVASLSEFAIAAVVLVVALPAMLVRRRTGSLQALRALRLVALVSTMLTAFIEFATEGFGALINLAVGVFVLAVLSFQVSQAETRHEGASVGSV
ncbi:hypothetical protein [Melissospora conviva]|uniref:hypothetical protein n=1 Tax=Melissospora conviva TaxID=3388432 RepID=UPI003C189E84